MLLFSISMYAPNCYCLLRPCSWKTELGPQGGWGVTAVPLKDGSTRTELSVLPGGLCSRERLHFSFFFPFLVPPLCFGLLWGEFCSACLQRLPHQGGLSDPAPVRVTTFHKQVLAKVRKALSLRAPANCFHCLLPQVLAPWSGQYQSELQLPET